MLTDELKFVRSYAYTKAMTNNFNYNFYTLKPL